MRDARLAGSLPPELVEPVETNGDSPVLQDISCPALSDSSFQCTLYSTVKWTNADESLGKFCGSSNRDGNVYEESNFEPVVHWHLKIS